MEGWPGAAAVSQVRPPPKAMGLGILIRHLIHLPNPLPPAPPQAYRNTVPVPRHWSQKRKYLQGKRGLEKPPFKLPDFIEATGIAEMRTAYQAKEDAKKMKQKQRERMAPKMGRMDIDYQVGLYSFQFKEKRSCCGEGGKRKGWREWGGVTCMTS